uniref:Uncharacterized protein n=1 Tax=viral metagenome TaxID=1070528 RepID=A0A6C0K5M9_9ZZZZ
MDTNAIIYHSIKYGIFAMIGIGFLGLLIGSAIVRDTFYITTHPRFFAMETIAMGLLSSIPILLIAYFRQGTLLTTILEFLFFFVKLAAIHVGLQLSGVYSVLFPKTSGIPKT